MSPKLINNLNLFTLTVNESAELAEQKAKEFVDKFKTLGKYDQLAISVLMDTNNWEKAFEEINKL
jgi:hypothetical protein